MWESVGKHGSQVGLRKGFPSQERTRHLLGEEAEGTQREGLWPGKLPEYRLFSFLGKCQGLSLPGLRAACQGWAPEVLGSAPGLS